MTKLTKKDFKIALKVINEITMENNIIYSTDIKNIIIRRLEYMRSH